MSVRRGDSEEGIAIEPKRLALLAYLALPHPGSHRDRGEIVGHFWPERGESAARNALRQALHHLRDRLGARAFVGSGRQRIGLDPEVVACDAARFGTALEQGRPAAALRVYRGEFMAGFSAVDSVSLDRWIEDERTRLRDAAVEAALSVARDERERANLEGALHWIRRGREMAPYDERLLRAEIRLRAALGDVVDAIRAFREFRDRVRTELGAEPSACTRRLADDLADDLPTRSMTAIRRSRDLFGKVDEEIRRSMALVERMRGSLDRPANPEDR